MNEHDIGCQCLPILYKRAKEAYQEEHRTYHDIFTLKPASVSMELLNEYNLFMDREVKNTMQMINTIRLANNLKELSIYEVLTMEDNNDD
uniref:Uncharacterized protein n=1 Tax=Siphoviridae sp. ctWT735 TaxID=2825538 RepID=A0A8S5TU98_9CAUD|nr:MAG TPA: hypothetical protein [Siphoviridae sp. ctWT735]